jgi:anaphase-promoting complex subunit 2
MELAQVKSALFDREEHSKVSLVSEKVNEFMELLNTRLDTFEKSDINRNLNVLQAIPWLDALLVTAQDIKKEASSIFEDFVGAGVCCSPMDHAVQLLNAVICDRYNSKVESAVFVCTVHLIRRCKMNKDNVYELMSSPLLLKLHACRWHLLFADTIKQAVLAAIDEHVRKECKGDHEPGKLAVLQQWVDDCVSPLSRKALGFQPRPDHTNKVSNSGSSNSSSSTNSSSSSSSIIGCNNSSGSKSSLEEELCGAVCEAFSVARAEELFEMVADFPDTYGAMRELRRAASAASSEARVAHIFRKAVCRRLLHSGASTTQILDMYVTMIRALRVVDPSDLLLNFLAVPVREYLLSRKETVRCIVESLTNGKDSDLHSELRRGGSLEYGADSDDEDGGPGQDWTPVRRSPDLPEFGSGARGIDVLALLVSLYGSTDVFVSEYRTLLAGKLLANLSYYSDHEVATLELLKIRFGEEPLHSCEVMLRDLEESRRTNFTVHSDAVKLVNKCRKRAKGGEGEKKGGEEGEEGEECDTVVAAAAGDSPEALAAAESARCVDFIIVSDNYWPKLVQEEIKHHPDALALLREYESCYAELKKPRKLHPVNRLGRVQLELSFDDGCTRDFSVNPVQATLIMHVAESGDSATCLRQQGERGVRASALAAAAQMEAYKVRRHMGLWVSRHVVTEQSVEVRVDAPPVLDYVDYVGSFAGDSGQPEDDVLYEIVEAQEVWIAAEAVAAGGVGGDGLDMNDSEQMEGGGAVDAQRQAIVQRHEIRTYVQGMLTSHGQMALERLHSMLRMLTAGGSSSGGDTGFDMTTGQLKGLLGEMADEGILEAIDGCYLLKAANTAARAQ